MKTDRQQASLRLRRSRNRLSLLEHTTGAEAAACRALHEAGIKYISQYPIVTGRQTFFADIYIPSLRLVLEIDGGYHFTPEQRRRDANRSAAMRRLGYHIYRLTNAEARRPGRVVAKIARLTAEHKARG